MTDIIKIEEVKSVIIPLRGEDVILDVDVARLYGVETRIINQAVKNNPDKFPKGYLLLPNKKELTDLRSKYLIAKLSPKSRSIPKAFTERGLYMLATILKSPEAVKTTLAIIDIFTKVREVRREITSVHDSEEEMSDAKQMKVISKVGALIADILSPELKITETESSMELNIIIGKIKHTVKRTRTQDITQKLLKEKVEIAKRMIANGYAMGEIVKLLDFNEEDVALLESWRKFP